MSLIKTLNFANPRYKYRDTKGGFSNFMDEKCIYKLGDDFQLIVMFTRGVPGGEFSTDNEFCIFLLIDRFELTNNQVITDIRSS